MNHYPTSKEEAALKDALKHEGDSLAERAERIGVTRGGVLHLMRRLEAKGLAAQSVGGKWVVTLAGRKWLRPAMNSRRQ